MKTKEKQQIRLEKRRKRINARLENSTRAHQVVIGRSNKHFYAQVYNVAEQKTIIGVSTTSKNFKPAGGRNNIESCKLLASELAGKMKEKSISEAVFNRAGLRFHGRVKAFAEALRENGITI